MIYTVTLNPAIDCFVTLENLELGRLNNSKDTTIFAGGKGINISIMLNRLGLMSTALGFLAGATGDFIEKELLKEGIKTDFVRVNNGLSRVNVKLLSDVETEINGEGPKIDEAELSEFFEKLAKIKPGDTICLAGSVPPSLPCDIYKKMLAKLPSGVRIVCDARGEFLRQTLAFSPFLIKPNLEELSEIFGVTIENAEDSIPYAKKLQEMGAQNVLVSMGSGGALLLDENELVHFCPAASGDVISAVGSGDSMIAGFLTGAAHGDFEEALLFASAAGGATAFSRGIAGRDTVMEVLKTLE